MHIQPTLQKHTGTVPGTSLLPIANSSNANINVSVWYTALLPL
jgi:hypothetical protein